MERAARTGERYVVRSERREARSAASSAIPSSPGTFGDPSSAGSRCPTLELAANGPHRPAPSRLATHLTAHQQPGVWPDSRRRRRAPSTSTSVCGATPGTRRRLTVAASAATRSCGRRRKRHAAPDGDHELLSRSPAARASSSRSHRFGHGYFYIGSVTGASPIPGRRPAASQFRARAVPVTAALDAYGGVTPNLRSSTSAHSRRSIGRSVRSPYSKRTSESGVSFVRPRAVATETTGSPVNGDSGAAWR